MLIHSFWDFIKAFLVSVDLMKASGVLEKVKCFGLTGKEGDILVSHCLLLASFYIFSRKYKGSKPPIVEYNYHVKESLKTTL